MSANETQVGGTHYSAHGEKGLQHWDVVRIFKLGYFEGNITKYVFRWRHKGGLQDLEKARHYLDKLIEIAKVETVPGAKLSTLVEEYEMRQAVFAPDTAAQPLAGTLGELAGLPPGKIVMQGGKQAEWVPRNPG